MFSLKCKLTLCLPHQNAVKQNIQNSLIVNCKCYYYYKDYLLRESRIDIANCKGIAFQNVTREIKMIALEKACYCFNNNNSNLISNSSPNLARYKNRKAWQKPQYYDFVILYPIEILTSYAASASS